MPSCRSLDPSSPPPSDAAPGAARARREENLPGRLERRFAELLAPRRTPRDDSAAPPGHEPFPGPRAPELRLRAGAESAERPLPAAAPPGEVRPTLDVGLREIRAAEGADGSLLRFVVEDGSLAGARMAFFLRGDLLDVAIEAPAGAMLERLRDRESDVREALAARGLELGRFDADGRNGRDEGRDGEPGDQTPSPGGRRPRAGRREPDEVR
jgi:hypothetical protein